MDFNSSSDSEADSPVHTPKKQRIATTCDKQKHREQKFRMDWLKDSEFKQWLAPVRSKFALFL